MSMETMPLKNRKKLVLPYLDSYEASSYELPSIQTPIELCCHPVTILLE